ncbi:MAG: FAD-binding oxidoreductase [Acidobacteria bacterium]|nr:MAG: FAD-binding oxidoreductase [Acidobacteriota bacterium]
MSILSADAVAQLRSGIRGAVLTPGDPGYDPARTIWNGMVDRRPALIVRCAGVSDVRRAVAFGREQKLTIAVRGGGHHIAGSAVCDGGVMIDLSQMRSVRVDPARRRAFVEPGATLRDFDHEAQAFGLATPLGINSTTGVAGLTLGGGFGWLSRRYGMTVDNLLSADVVTADGTLLQASEGDHPDLFWALRGGGGNFGVVTRFEFELHPVGPQVFGGLVVFPADQGRTVLQRYREFVKDAPDELSVWVVLRQAPPLPFLPAGTHGTNVIVLPVCYSGPVESGPSVVAPLREFGRPIGEHLGPVPYTAWQQAFDPLLAPGARNYWKSHNFATLPDELLDVLLRFSAEVPSSQSEVFLAQLGGRASRIPAEATAYPHRDALFVMNVHGRWNTPAEDQEGVAWARACFNASAPFATGGVYVNFLTADETDRVAAAYGGHYSRLVRVKGTYDPENVFCVNQNIRPAAT